MRTSIVTRSVIAVASLAISSAALAITPATATTTPSTASSITRDMVLTHAAHLRHMDETGGSPTFAEQRGLWRLVELACDFEEEGNNWFITATRNAPQSAEGPVDGLMVTARLAEFDDQGNGSERQCTFVALATKDPAAELSGDVSMNLGIVKGGDVPQGTYDTKILTSKASGNVYVTPAFNSSEYVLFGSFTAAGATTRTTSTTTNKTVVTPKSAAVKEAAKKAYDTKLKTARKVYTKALKKAGKSKASKRKKMKAAANKVYNEKKATAKAAYTKAIATTSEIVPTTITHVENGDPFSLNATLRVR